MLNNFKIGTRLFGMAIIVAVIMSLVGWQGLRTLAQTTEAMHSSLGFAERVSGAMDRTRDAQVDFKRQVQEWKDLLIRGHKREDFDKYFESFNREERTVQTELAETRDSLKALGFDVNPVEGLIRDHAALGARYREALKQFSPGVMQSTALVDNLVRGVDRPVTDRLDSIVTNAHDAGQSRVITMRQNADDAVHRARLTLLISLFLAIVIAIALAWSVIRSVTLPLYRLVVMADRVAEGDLRLVETSASDDEVGRLHSAMERMAQSLAQTIGQVRSTADALSGAASQVSATAQSLSQGTSEQAASVEETSASLEQMSASITQNAENSRQTEQMATKGASDAADGGRSAEETMVAMKTIAQKISIIED